MLVQEADKALQRSPPSVMDKTETPPSGDKHDYWHPAPYWWPDPSTTDGLPYIHKDGKRVPGTLIYGPNSDKYDRTRLQYVFDDSITLALAWKFTGKKSYVQHAGEILDRFFLNPATRMNPNLNYSQVKPGHKDNRGSATGVIEMKDLYFYLDAVRILEAAQVLSRQQIRTFKKWLSDYLDWILTSAQGIKECSSKNNHGTYYDIQVAALASYLSNRKLLKETLLRSQKRVLDQFAADGTQPHEMKRTITAHYCSFNLLGWLVLAKFAENSQTNLWQYTAPNGASLQQAIKWLLALAGKPWPFPQLEHFNPERLAPIRFITPASIISTQAVAAFPTSKYACTSYFHPHDGIKPYWNLGLKTLSSRN